MESKRGGFLLGVIAEIGPRPSPNILLTVSTTDGIMSWNLDGLLPIQQQNNTRQCSYIEHEENDSRFFVVQEKLE